MKSSMRILIIAALTVLTLQLTSTHSFAQTNQIENKQVLMKKNLETFSYSLALQAANWGLPIVIMYNLRYNDALKKGAKSKPNQIWRLEDITTPELAKKAGYVTPNVNVIYGFGFLDLSDEPIILSVPDSNDRYYMVQLVDMYTNSFAYVGGVATGYKGGKFALVGPDWKGELPAGVTRIDAPTSWILIQPRVHVKNESDLSEAKKVLNNITVKGLAEYNGGKPTAPKSYTFMQPDLTNPALPVSAVDFKDPLQFFEIMSAAINANPPPQDQINALLPLFKPLGIEFGKQWDRSKIPPVIVDSMRRAAQEIGSLNENLPVGEFINSWFMPPPAIGNAKTDYYLRSIVARIGLTANTPQEAIYFMSATDDQQQNIMSNKKYTLTFKQLPPFIKPGFWSLTLYSSANNYNVENSMKRYSLGSDNNLKLNADGSLTVFIQSESPGKDNEANWLPSGSGSQPVYLILRSYAPGKAMIDALSNTAAFTVPAAVEVK